MLLRVLQGTGQSFSPFPQELASSMSIMLRSRITDLKPREGVQSHSELGFGLWDRDGGMEGCDWASKPLAAPVVSST